jgi:hypothetical protein
LHSSSKAPGWCERVRGWETHVMCVCHGFPGAEAQSMLGPVEQRRDGASRLRKGGESGGCAAEELKRGSPSGGPAWSPPRTQSCWLPDPKSGPCGQTALGGSDPQRKAVQVHGDPRVQGPGASPKRQHGSCTPGTEIEGASV